MAILLFLQTIQINLKYIVFHKTNQKKSSQLLIKMHLVLLFLYQRIDLHQFQMENVKFGKEIFLITKLLLLNLKQGDLTDIRLFQIKDREILTILVSESIQLWALNEYKFLKSIKIHSDYSLFIVQIDDETILSGSSVVNIKTGQYYSFVIASFYSFKSAIKLRDDRILIFGKEHDIEHEGD